MIMQHIEFTIEIQVIQYPMFVSLVYSRLKRVSCSYTHIFSALKLRFRRVVAILSFLTLFMVVHRICQLAKPHLTGLVSFLQYGL